MYVHKTRPAAVEEVPGKDPSSPVSELLRQKFRAFFPTHVDGGGRRGAAAADTAPEKGGPQYIII